MIFSFYSWYFAAVTLIILPFNKIHISNLYIHSLDWVDFSLFAHQFSTFCLIVIFPLFSPPPLDCIAIKANESVVEVDCNMLTAPFPYIHMNSAHSRYFVRIRQVGEICPIFFPILLTSLMVVSFYFSSYYNAHIFVQISWMRFHVCGYYPSRWSGMRSDCILYIAMATIILQSTRCRMEEKIMWTNHNKRFAAKAT